MNLGAVGAQKPHSVVVVVESEKVRLPQNKSFKNTYR